MTSCFHIMGPMARQHDSWNYCADSYQILLTNEGQLLVSLVVNWSNVCYLQLPCWKCQSVLLKANEQHTCTYEFEDDAWGERPVGCSVAAIPQFIRQSAVTPSAVVPAVDYSSLITHTTIQLHLIHNHRRYFFNIKHKTSLKTHKISCTNFTATNRAVKLFCANLLKYEYIHGQNN